MPAPMKPADKLRKRNRAELWTILPPEGCKVAAPKWPNGKPSPGEADLWKRLWRLPVAAWWREQQLEPFVVARYVSLAIEKPAHASVSQLEGSLGLTPAAMQRMRLVVEPEEAPQNSGREHYKHLREVKAG